MIDISIFHGIVAINIYTLRHDYEYFVLSPASFTTRHVDDDNDNGWIFCDTEKKYDRSFDIFYGLFVVAAKLSSKIKRGYLCALENKALSPSL